MSPSQTHFSVNIDKFDRPPAYVTDLGAPGRIVIKRETVEEHLGRKWDPQELHLDLISLSGNIDETEDEFSLEWRGR